MNFLKELFTEPLTYEAFEAACGEKGYKLADLSSGEYVAKGKLTAESEKLKSIQAKLTEYEAQIAALKASADNSETLKDKITELETAIAQRKAAEDAALEASALSERFAKVSGNRKFLNEYTERGVFEEFKTALSAKENEGKSDAEIYERLTENRDGLFENVNPPVPFPCTDPIAADTLEEAHVRAVMGLPAKNQ